jgi:hypothetical protein
MIIQGCKATICSLASPRHGPMCPPCLGIQSHERFALAYQPEINTSNTRIQYLRLRGTHCDCSCDRAEVVALFGVLCADCRNNKDLKQALAYQCIIDNGWNVPQADRSVPKLKFCWCNLHKWVPSHLKYTHDPCFKDPEHPWCSTFTRWCELQSLTYHDNNRQLVSLRVSTPSTCLSTS